jgi:hypothetical protein
MLIRLKDDTFALPGAGLKKSTRGIATIRIRVIPMRIPAPIMSTAGGLRLLGFIYSTSLSVGLRSPTP